MNSNLLSDNPRHSPPEYTFEQSSAVPVAVESAPVLQSQPKQPTEGSMAGLLDDLDI
jgi:hypothetical protein